MALISPEYLALNRELHERDEHYGTSGSKWAAHVDALARKLGTEDILDYGCGKRTLERGLGYSIRNYDPCIPGLDTRPEPADIVICGDVLEHVEPDMIDRVLDDIARLTKRAVFFIVSTRPAIRTLADGRNAHLTVEPMEWWTKRIEKRFRMCREWGHEHGFVFIGQSMRDQERMPDLGAIGPPAGMKRVSAKSVYTSDQRIANIRSSILRGLPSIKMLPAHGKTMILACYGPSLQDTFEMIEKEQRAGGDLYTVSGAHRFLIERGIIPIGHIEADPRPHKALTFGKPDSRIAYFLASACAREMFDAVHGFETWVYHVNSFPEENQFIQSMEPGALQIYGGSTVGMGAIALGNALGYRRFSIHGMDCSFKVSDELLHWPKDVDMPATMRKQVEWHAGWHPNDDQDIYRPWLDGRPFVTSFQMCQQAQDFMILASTNRQLKFRIHGDGLLPALARKTRIIPEHYFPRAA